MLYRVRPKINLAQYLIYTSRQEQTLRRRKKTTQNKQGPHELSLFYLAIVLIIPKGSLQQVTSAATNGATLHLHI